VAVLFLDTSALIRRYDRTEPGADRVRALCRRNSGHSLVIAAVTPTEVASALNRKRREGRFTQAQYAQVWRVFRGHCRQRYYVLQADEQIYQQAQRLLSTYVVRGYDALQLASALGMARLVTSIPAEFRFCTADRAQAAAAGQEGLLVELIQ
jgi:predicted nucleic acid-binding protein